MVYYEKENDLYLCISKIFCCCTYLNINSRFSKKSSMCLKYFPPTAAKCSCFIRTSDDSKTDLCNSFVREKENAECCGRQQPPVSLSSLAFIVCCCLCKDLYFFSVIQIPWWRTWATLWKWGCKQTILLSQQIV